MQHTYKTNVLHSSLTTESLRLQFGEKDNKRHVLVGDGMHDDTHAVQALIRGDAVFYADGTRAVKGFLRAGNYKVNAPLVGRDCIIGKLEQLFQEPLAPPANQRSALVVSLDD